MAIARTGHGISVTRTVYLFALGLFMHRLTVSWFHFLIILTFLGSAQSKASDVEKAVDRTPVVVIPSDVIAAFSHFTSAQNPLDIKDFSQPGLWRDVVELVLLHQALHIGGYKGQIELSAEDNYRRQLRRVDSGDAVMVGASVWRTDALRYQYLRLSEPLIRDHEYRVGLYTLPTNSKALSVKRLEDMRDLVLVSHRGWSADWQAAQSMSPKRLDDSPGFDSMIRMVQFGRADAALMAFRSNDDFSLQRYGATLVPIPNVAVSLPDSRHWVVSSRHPQGMSFNHYLNAGLAQLRASGLLEQAYHQAGVLDDRVQDWSVINPRWVNSVIVN